MLSQKWNIKVFLVIFMVMVLVSPVVTGQQEEGGFTKIIENARPSVVQIVVGEDNKGSGFIISSDGYILTAYHVVENAKEITVQMEDDQEYEAELVSYHGGADIALLDIDGKDFPTIKLASSEDAKLGSNVLALGYPAPGDSFTATKGLLSSLKEEQGRKTLQISSPVNPGNSGGPLLNSSGQVVGIVFAKADLGKYLQQYGTVPEGIGFAIPVEKATNYFNIDDRGKPHIERIEHYEENFTDPESGWPIVDGEIASKEYGDETYNITIKKKNYEVVALVPVPVSAKEFTFEVSAKSENEEGAYGIIFGYEDSDNMYEFIVTQHGYYGFNRKSHGNWSGRGKWNESTYVNEEGENTLKVEVTSGNNFTFFVNGHKVKYIMMEMGYQGGRVGLATWGFEKDFETQFHDLSLDVESRS
ncbi:serine protease [Candidatus Bipolaricaulota bacterium]|nr:serine protease [Candidatus Bipolaricaulota bacterium]